MLTGQLGTTASLPGALEPGLLPGFLLPGAIPVQIDANDSLDGMWTPWKVNGYKLGQVVEFMARAYLGGVLSNVAGLSVVIADASVPVLTFAGNLSNDGAGLYHASILIPLTATPGVWHARWSVLGQAIAERGFYVDSLAY